MATVRMRASVSGTRDGQPWPPAGAAIQLPDAEAQALVAARLAELIDKPVEEHAVAPAQVETATRRTRKRG